MRRLSATTRKSAPLFVAFCALVFAHTALAQNPAAPAGAGTYRIAGTVLSSADGHPLAGATVTIRLSDAPANPSLRSTTSADDGRFEFTGLPAGNFTLQGSARNFLATYYDDHDGFTTGIITGSTVPTDALRLRLVPKASLSGTITNEAGEPVQNAQVRLFRQSHDLGDGRIVPAGTQQTDDLGRFDFASLSPADYLVAVTAQPWYAVHPQPPPVNRLPTLPANATPQQQAQLQAVLANMRRQALFGVTGPLDPALDVAYPITYYPHGSDSTEAEPIPLRPGDSRQISLELSPLPAVTITIPHPAVQPLQMADPQSPNYQASLTEMLQAQQRQQQQMPQLRVSIFGNIEPAPAQQMQSTPTSTTFSGLPPGDYLLASSNTPVNQSSGATPIHLTGGDSDSARSIASALPDPATLAHVHITLQTPSGSPPANIPVGLIRAGSHDVFIRNAALKGETILDAPPGDYAFAIQPGKAGVMNARASRSWFLRSITAGGKPLAANSIHLAAGDAPSFTLILVAGEHTLRGFVVHTPDSAAQSAPTTRDAVIPGEAERAQQGGAEPRDPRIAPDQIHSSAQPQPAPGVFLLLIPTDELASDSRHYWRDQSDLDGSFSIAGLAPGSYTLFAIDDGWNLDWQQPHALDRYLPAAAQIVIPENAPPTFSFPHLIPVQPK